MNEQLSFGATGNITPCPYREECSTYKIGCQGNSKWCQDGPFKKEKTDAN